MGVKLLSSSEASVFLEEHHEEGPVLLKTKIVHLGFQVEGALVAVAQFGLPEDKFRRKRYTSELHRLAVTPMVEKFQAAQALMSAYLALCRPSNFCAVASSNGEEQMLEGFGLTEDPTGEGLFAWVDSELTHYVYRVTATDSEKYYFGVSHVKKADATIEDCLTDNYWGSGDNKRAKTNKFLNWRRKHENSLKKEILGIFKRTAEAYLLEKDLVGDLWKTDPQCLNSAPGGRHGAPPLPMITLKECVIHGLSKFRGEACYRCFITARFFLDHCAMHGMTLHSGGRCLRCGALSKIEVQTCAVHGEVPHKGNVCYRCEQEDVVSVRECNTHGLSTHQGNICSSCTMEKNVFLKDCPSHGKVKHRGDHCYPCETEKRMQNGDCEVHGVGVFYGGKTCAKCAVGGRDKMAFCLRHGVVKHAGKSCRSCAPDQTAHTRFHREDREDCRFCVSEDHG